MSQRVGFLSGASISDKDLITDAVNQLLYHDESGFYFIKYCDDHDQIAFEDTLDYLNQQMNKDPFALSEKSIGERKLRTFIDFGLANHLLSPLASPFLFHEDYAVDHANLDLFFQTILDYLKLPVHNALLAFLKMKGYRLLQKEPRKMPFMPKLQGTDRVPVANCDQNVDVKSSVDEQPESAANKNVFFANTNDLLEPESNSHIHETLEAVNAALSSSEDAVVNYEPVDDDNYDPFLDATPDDEIAAASSSSSGFASAESSTAFAIESVSDDDVDASDSSDHDNSFLNHETMDSSVLYEGPNDSLNDEAFEELLSDSDEDYETVSVNDISDDDDEAQSETESASFTASEASIADLISQHSDLSSVNDFINMDSNEQSLALAAIPDDILPDVTFLNGDRLVDGDSISKIADLMESEGNDDDESMSDEEKWLPVADQESAHQTDFNSIKSMMNHISNLVELNASLVDTLNTLMKLDDKTDSVEETEDLLDSPSAYLNEFKMPLRLVEAQAIINAINAKLIFKFHFRAFLVLKIDPKKLVELQSHDFHSSKAFWQSVLYLVDCFDLQKSVDEAILNDGPHQFGSNDDNLESLMTPAQMAELDANADDLESAHEHNQKPLDLSYDSDSDHAFLDVLKHLLLGKLHLHFHWDDWGHTFGDHNWNAFPDILQHLDEMIQISPIDREKTSYDPFLDQLTMSPYHHYPLASKRKFLDEHLEVKPREKDNGYYDVTVHHLTNSSSAFDFEHLNYQQVKTLAEMLYASYLDPQDDRG